MSEQNSPSELVQELTLIKFLLVREHFDKYSFYVKDLNFEPETELLLKSIEEYFKEYPSKDVIEVEELLLYNSMRNPLVRKRNIFTTLFEKLGEINLNSELVEENFNSILEKYFSSEILFKISESLEDNSAGVLDSVAELCEQYSNLKLRLQKKNFNFVTTDISELVAKKKEKPGLLWRISGLNEHLGEIRGKTLGHIFARPDTGKTSFLFSEESFWISQLKEGEILLHLNNEEDGEKLMARFYQSLLNVPQEILETHTDKCKEEFQRLGGEKLHLYDEAIIDIDDIKALFEAYNVRVCVIDQADKLHFKGMAKMGDVQRLQAIYAKLRELAKKFDVHIITVGQASVTAENKKWLMPSDLDGSKTLKPGEFDYIIGIGKKLDDMHTDQENLRYLHLCKNKLGTGMHAKIEVTFDPTRARYSEPVYNELGGDYTYSKPFCLGLQQ